MESMTFLLGFLMPTLVTAVVIFLYLRAEKAQMAQAAETAKLVQQTMELTIGLVREQAGAAEDSARASTETAKHMLEETVGQLEQMRASQNETLKMAQQSMDSTMMRASTGLTQVTEQVTRTLSSTVALLGTKDPVAYNHVMSGSTPPDLSDDPYPGMDDAEYERLEQERIANAAKISQAMEQLEKLGVARPDAE